MVGQRQLVRSGEQVRGVRVDDKMIGRAVMVVL